MSSYELLLFVHVLTAVVWVGGALSLQVLAIRAERSADGGRVANFATEAEWVGSRVFLPSSIVLLLAGIGLTLEGDWGFTTPWVLLGLIAYGLSALTGSLFLGPESGRIGKMIADVGPQDPDVLARIKRIFLVSRMELVVLLFIVFDMTVKPGS
jgi:uncharacterized membrane protein